MVRQTIADYIRKHKSEIFECGGRKFIKIKGKDVEIRTRKKPKRRVNKVLPKAQPKVKSNAQNTTNENLKNLSEQLKKQTEIQQAVQKALEQKQFMESLKNDVLNQVRNQQDLLRSMLTKPPVKPMRPLPIPPIKVTKAPVPKPPPPKVQPKIISEPTPEEIEERRIRREQERQIIEDTKKHLFFKFMSKDSTKKTQFAEAAGITPGRIKHGKKDFNRVSIKKIWNELTDAEKQVILDNIPEDATALDDAEVNAIIGEVANLQTRVVHPQYVDIPIPTEYVPTQPTYESYPIPSIPAQPLPTEFISQPLQPIGIPVQSMPTEPSQPVPPKVPVVPVPSIELSPTEETLESFQAPRTIPRPYDTLTPEEKGIVDVYIQRRQQGEPREQVESDLLGDHDQSGTGLSKLKHQKGLYNTDIDKIMTPYRLPPYNFLGVYSSDEIYKLAPLVAKLDIPVFSFISNLDRSDQPGSHWTATYVDARKKSKSNVNGQSAERYDSFGRQAPKDYLRQLKSLINTLVSKFDIDYPIKFKNNCIIDQNATGVGDNDCGWFSIKFLINRYNNVPFRKCTGYDDINEATNEMLDFKRNLIKFGYIYHPKELPANI